MRATEQPDAGTSPGVDAGDVDRQRGVVPGWLTLAHVAAAAVVVVGLLAQLFRPLAPDLGPAPDPTRWFDAEYLSTALAYRRPLYAAALAGLLLKIAIPLLAAFTPPGRHAAARIIVLVGQQRPARAAAAVAVMIVVASDVALLPLAFWSGFIHEGAYGFRTQGLAGWAYDWAVVHAPVWLLVAAAVAAGYALARRLPRAWPPVAALGASALTAVLVFAAPVVLEPLVYDTRPLPAGPVRMVVQRVIDNAGAPVDELLVADASRRTTKQNAYISGIAGTRRVVLYDTLVAGQPAEQVALIVAHELAHDRHADVLRGTLLGAAGVVIVVYLLALLVRWRARRGLQRGQADPRGAAAAVAVAVVLNVMAQPLALAVSRRAEAAADLGALNLTEDPATYIAMNAELATANLSDPLPPAWVRFLWSSHPPTVARLEMGERWPLDR